MDAGTAGWKQRLAATLAEYDQHEREAEGRDERYRLYRRAARIAERLDAWIEDPLELDRAELRKIAETLNDFAEELGYLDCF